MKGDKVVDRAEKVTNSFLFGQIWQWYRCALCLLYGVMSNSSRVRDTTDIVSKFRTNEITIEITTVMFGRLSYPY